MKTQLILGVLTLIAFPASAAMVSLTPAKDTVIYESATGALANGEGEYLFTGQNGGGGGRLEMRSLLTFDLSGIPAGATINSVTLNLTAGFRQGQFTTVETSLHRLTGDWGEGSSQGEDGEGGGGAATPGDATWIHRFSASSTWANAGGDFVSVASATTDVTGSGITYAWSGAGLTNDVQGFVDGDFDNFGWILIGEQNGTGKRFNSGNRLTGTDLPLLTVDFTPIPEPSTFGLLSLALLPVLKRHRSQAK